MFLLNRRGFICRVPSTFIYYCGDYLCWCITNVKTSFLVCQFSSFQGVRLVYIFRSQRVLILTFFLGGNQQPNTKTKVLVCLSLIVVGCFMLSFNAFFQVAASRPTVLVNLYLFCDFNCCLGFFPVDQKAYPFQSNLQNCLQIFLYI